MRLASRTYGLRLNDGGTKGQLMQLATIPLYCSDQEAGRHGTYNGQNLAIP